VHLTILICTHNRETLLARVLASLNAARRPHGARIDLLVVANACTDSTAALLERYARGGAANGWLPLRWAEEPVPGKSHALNRAIPLLESDLVAFVDDDHRVDHGFLVAICEAAASFPEATMFCGRIIPDWDGREPKWVHDEGPYRIYPLPVPRFNHPGPSREFGPNDPTPGGGNLIVRTAVFRQVGGFSPELGPHGHDLGGGEDIDWVMRAKAAGARLRYVPAIVQHHYVDLERLRFGYLLRKSYQRSRSSIQTQAAGSPQVPRYAWRKVAGYAFSALLALRWDAKRFFLVRTAAALGEIRGFLESKPGRPVSAEQARADLVHDHTTGLPWLLAFGVLCAALVAARPIQELATLAESVAAVAATACVALVIKSIVSFSRTGPELRREIWRHYSLYSLFALLRLAAWAFALLVGMAALGTVCYAALATAIGSPVSEGVALLAAAAGIALLAGLQFCRHLLYLPGSLAASSHYRFSRLYPLWHLLTPARLSAAWLATIALVGSAGCWAALALLLEGAWIPVVAGVAGGAAIWLVVRKLAAPTVVRADAPTGDGSRTLPNIVMIGSDTLRSDRFSATGYRRSLTPFIDRLATRGTHFTDCYVPCARTAPSLLSLFTGTWPHTHRIRDNFVSADDLRLAGPALPEILARHGYATAVVSDWSGSDFGKFRFGFRERDLPDDQWNIKYLIRQGPKDLRLFLSLFTHNRFGKLLLPELYYLAGVPVTNLVFRDARRAIAGMAGKQPFLLNVFASATHPPFGSEYPYYTLFSNPLYRGESKFAMARLTDPWEIIRRQGDSREEFDLEQIIDLYDGCVRSFDDEVARTFAYLESAGLADNTIVVLYSDHGMEFFEHDTWGQGNSVRGDASAKVPLVIVNRQRGGGTGVCERTVRSIDVAPTLLDLVGLPVPPSMEGVSLRPYLEGSTADLDLAAFNETGIWLNDVPGMPQSHLRYPNLLDLLEIPDKHQGTLTIKPEYRDIVVLAKDRMIRQGRWKLTYQPTEHGPIYALYDLVADPRAERDLSTSHPEVVAALGAKLRAWIGGVPRSGTEREASAETYASAG
jgi:arylsulfatase A-like enzyme/GT2 family glycosyltransferase